MFDKHGNQIGSDTNKAFALDDGQCKEYLRNDDLRGNYLKILEATKEQLDKRKSLRDIFGDCDEKKVKISLGHFQKNANEIIRNIEAPSEYNPIQIDTSSKTSYEDDLRKIAAIAGHILHFLESEKPAERDERKWDSSSEKPSPNNISDPKVVSPLKTT